LKDFCDDFIRNGKWYEWYDDHCPYDDSGDTRPIPSESKIDYIDNLDMHEDLCLLDYIYLGYWNPTHMSRLGKSHVSLAHKLMDDMYELFSIAVAEINGLSNPDDFEAKCELLECAEDGEAYGNLLDKVQALAGVAEGSSRNPAKRGLLEPLQSVPG